MMWITFARAPLPDAAYWPGRRLLGVIDAVAWPAIVFWLLTSIPGRGSVFVPVVSAGCALVGLSRVYAAIWTNHRYRFTTWKIGRVVLVLLAVGVALKIAVSTFA